jgi:hypothetical protein
VCAIKNNNRGGYNKGDKTDQAAGNDQNAQYQFQYFMSHPKAWEKPYNPTAEGRSILSVEWTNQHGCGGNEHDDPHKLNCNILLQYMCYPDHDERAEVYDMTRVSCTHECYMPRADNEDCSPSDTVPCARSPIPGEADCIAAGNHWLPAQVDDQFNCPHSCSNSASTASRELCTGNWATMGSTDFRIPRDGVTTDRQQFTEPSTVDESQQTRHGRKAGDVDRTEGLHETWEWYDECFRRERNRGIFTADQNLRNNRFGYSSAIYTRQNPNNNRRGYECPEERDHWPYWHPSPWIDIAVMTDRLDLCPFYQTESQNVKPKGLCRNTAACPGCIRYNTQAKCEAEEGRWVMAGAHNVPPPECIQSQWSRVNHLGNGRNGQPNSYNWTLPYITLNGRMDGQAVPQRCVLRLRYNISTDDYDGWRVNSTFNDNEGAGIVSPVRQNPNVDIGARTTALRLAINTAQFGRTFQDRSHVFRLVPRSQQSLTIARPRSDLPLDGNTNDFFGTRTLYNLNVRGKRGNIVQTFPSVEYDFMPNHLHIKQDDLVHIQWAGSNTHNNGNPAGDGQAGDAGEGRGGTDRHNLVQMLSDNFLASFPATWEQNTMFSHALDALDASVPEDSDTNPHVLSRTLDAGRNWEEVKRDWALRMATVGYYTSYNAPNDATSVEATRTSNREELQELLNNAPASYVGGIFRFKRGTYDYMCTRNHNFSNRDQKGHLVVDA